MSDSATCCSSGDRSCAHCGAEVGDDPHVVERDGERHLYCCGGCATGDAPDAPANDCGSASCEEALRLEELADGHVTHHDDGTVEAELHLEGIHCSSCVRTVERLPDELDGVVDARLSLARERLRVRWTPDRTSLESVDEWLRQFGYTPRPLDDEEASRAAQHERELLGRVGISWALAANVMMLTVPLYAGLDPETSPLLGHGARWTCLVLATITLAVGGRSFFERAWSSIRQLGGGPFYLSMDVPISLGLATGWTYSVWSTVAGTGEVWFDSISVLVAALLTARWLKARGRRRAVDASSRLAELVPSAARLADDPDRRISVDELEAGTTVRVPAGERVPVDGEVVDGESSVSRAILTGESRPVAVAPGSDVLAGVENLTDDLVVRTEEAGDATRVGRMMQWLDEENETSSQTEFADRFGGAFVAATLLAAVGTALFWASTTGATAAIEPVVAVLVIACPCALGLATPLASTVASGRAASQGLFVERKGVFETLNDAASVVFDKTGTLTTGETRIVDRRGDDEALRLAALLELHSTHPLAAAFRPHLSGASSDIEDVEETAGAGISGRVDGHDVRVGRPDWVREDVDAVAGDLEVEAGTEDFSKRGLTPVGISVDGEYRALAGVGDPIRDDTADVLDELRASGRSIRLLSGDHPTTVEATARQLGLDDDHAHGGVEPEQKVEHLRQLRESTDGPVVMVGDGVNDTVALDEADVGVAVGDASDAALGAADVVCRRPGITPIGWLFEGSRSLGRTVRGLLLGSVAYNVVAVAAAAAGWIGPLAAAVLMPASSTAVVSVALVQPAFRAGASDPERAEEHPPAEGRSEPQLAASGGS